MFSDHSHPSAIAEETVTFLFTDIEGSTQLWEQHPEAMRKALADHHTILRDAIEGHGGSVFKTLGDQCCAAFALAPDALAAAVAAQRALRDCGLRIADCGIGEPTPSDAPSPSTLRIPHSAIRNPQSIRVRMALHTGSVEAREGDYHGPVLNRVARLMSAGHGGQVLLSQAARDLVRDALPEGTSLRDLGEHRLKDLSRPERIFQLVAPDLPADFPSLNTLGSRGHNLPLQLTSFIGREAQMADVERLMGEHRLVTLTGAGGCGKTRLALQIAADLVDTYPDGVWLAELSELADPALVPRTVAFALGAREEPNRRLVETLEDHLKPRHLLLLLDNCEHVLPACAQLAERLLRSCPHLKILASSREGLNVAGETTYRVPSLSLPGDRPPTTDHRRPTRRPTSPPHHPTTPPPDTRHPTPDTLLQYEAVRLFVDRAMDALPSFAVTEQNAPALAQICRRLDGIPLAIELAAARVRMLPPEQIDARLNDRFGLLTRGSRTAFPRQQTLRALIDWSYDLLTDEERALLRRLSVFAGGWTLEAAEAVCAEEGVGYWVLGVGDGASPPTPNTQYPTPPREAWSVLDLLTALVEKSLVIVEVGPGAARYRLLESVRQYGRERLLELGEEEQSRLRHLAYFLQLAEETEPKLTGPEQGTWLERLEEEHDNLRAALEWAVAVGSGQSAGSSGQSAVGSGQSARSSKHETMGPLLPTADCPLPTAALPTAHCPLLTALRLGGALWRFWLVRGYLAEGRERLQALLAAVGAAERTAARAKALIGAGNLARRQGDYGTARALHEESLAIRRDLGDRQDIASSLNNLASVAYAQGDYGAARALCEESLAIKRALGDRQGIASSLNSLGMIARVQGEYGTAQALYEESLAIRREVGDKRGIAISLNGLGMVARAQGEYARARALCRESLVLLESLGDKPGLAECLSELAKVAAMGGDAERAVRLFGFAEALREAIGAPLAPAVRAEYERFVAASRAALGEATFADAWAEGRALLLEEAIRIA